MFHPTPSNKISRVTTLPYRPVTHQATFTIMGEPLLFQTNSEQLLAIAHTTFGKFNTHKIQPTLDTPPLLIRLFIKKARHPLPKPYPKPVIHIGNHLFYLNIGAENSLVVDLAKGEAFGYLTHALIADPEFIRYTFLEAASQSMLGLSRNFVAIHAAGVVKNGASLLLMGDSGVGKSTLAYACVQGGYRLLAEDVVQVKLTPDTTTFWGLPWTLHLLPDSSRFFPQIAHEPILLQVNGEEKIEVQLQDSQTVTHTPHAQFLFLERNPHTPAGIFPLPYETALAQFQAIWSWEIGWQDWYDNTLATMLKQGTYRFNLGATPVESVALLDQFVNDTVG